MEPSPENADHRPMPPIAVIALDHRIAWASPALCEMLKRDLSDLAGQLIDNIVHPDDVHLDAHLLLQLSAGTIPSYEITKRLLCNDGTPLVTRLLATAIRDRAGRSVALTLTIESPTANLPESPIPQSDIDDEMEKIRRAILG